MFKRNRAQIQLPKKFAQDLLDCQIQLKLSDKPSQQIIKKTIQLYTIGVQYYQSIRSYKYLYFQQKMTDLFMSQTINNVLDPEKQKQQTHIDQKNKINSQEDRIQAIKVKQKQQRIKNQIIQRTKDQTTENQVKVILDKSQDAHAKVKQKIKGEIQNQDKQLQQKMMRRKSRMLVARSNSLYQNIGEVQSKSSNCTKQEEKDRDFGVQSPAKKVVKIKPLQVSFNSIIHQSQDQDQAHHADKQHKKVRKLSISDKIRKAKTKSTSDLLQQNQTQNEEGI